MSPLPKLNRTQTEAYRRDWMTAVGDLVEEVRRWSEEQQWSVREEPRELTEGRLGTYQAPAIEIKSSRGDLWLEPIARDVMGGEGRVDFYVYPSLFKVYLYRTAEGEWVVRTPFGPKWPHAWGRDTFLELAEALLDEA